jgi:hypothetical protein
MVSNALWISHSEGAEARRRQSPSYPKRTQRAQRTQNSPTPLFAVCVENLGKAWSSPTLHREGRKICVRGAHRVKATVWCERAARVVRLNVPAHPRPVTPQSQWRWALALSVYLEYTEGMESTNQLERFIDELRRRWPIARGSLCEVAKPCVRAGCAACAHGDKHLSFIFSYRKDGKQRCLYVSRELVAELRRAIDGGQWVESRMSELGAALVFAHRERHQSTAPRPKRRKPKT